MCAVRPVSLEFALTFEPAAELHSVVVRGSARKLEVTADRNLAGAVALLVCIRSTLMGEPRKKSQGKPK
jgi:hypothetical protein